MRAVFLGTPEAALPSIRALLRAGHIIPLVVTPPDRPAGRGRNLAPCPVKQFAFDQKIPVFQTEKIRRDPEILDLLKATAAEIQIVVAFGQIIPKNIIDLPFHSTINVHFSLLPRFRGASPVAAAILAGETRTGVTIFCLNEKMDEGDLLSEAELEIGATETAGELETRLAALGAELLIRTLPEIEKITLRPQDHSQATFAPKLRKEDGHLNWRQTATEIDRRARAMTPWPSAYTFHKSERLIVVSGQPEKTSLFPAERIPPAGMVVDLSKKGIGVVCGEGTLYRITRVHPESRPPMEAHAFILGGKIGINDLLE